MELNFFKGSTLINAPTAAMVDVTSNPGQLRIPGFVPIDLNELVDILIEDEATEVGQITRITLPTTPVASTQYSFGIFPTKGMKHFRNLHAQPVRASAPAILSGSADVDKLNIGIMWGRIINEKKEWYAEAGPRITLTVANGTQYTVGEIVRGGTSNAYGIVRAGGSATTVVIDVYGGLFAGTETITGETSGVAKAMSAVAYSGYFYITEKTGYYPARSGRAGALSVYPGTNIPAASISVTQQAVLGFGMGGRLLQDVPGFETSTGTLHKGLLDFPTNEAPVSGQLYKRAIILYGKETSDSVINEATKEARFAYAIWYDNDAAGSAAFQAALLALV